MFFFLHRVTVSIIIKRAFGICYLSAVRFRSLRVIGWHWTDSKRIHCWENKESPHTWAWGYQVIPRQKVQVWVKSHVTGAQVESFWFCPNEQIHDSSLTEVTAGQLVKKRKKNKTKHRSSQKCLTGLLKMCSHRLQHGCNQATPTSHCWSEKSDTLSKLFTMWKHSLLLDGQSSKTMCADCQRAPLYLT